MDTYRKREGEMAGKKDFAKFIDYYSKPLSRDRVEYLNQLNVVETEKVELFRDYIISLTRLIGDTFLGEKVIFTDEHFKAHFNWCWKKNIDNFSLEGLHFDELGEHYYYFYKYFYEMFYNRPDKPKTFIDKIQEFWEDIMGTHRIKTNSEYDLFINLYKIQTKHFKNTFT